MRHIDINKNLHTFNNKCIIIINNNKIETL